MLDTDFCRYDGLFVDYVKSDAAHNMDAHQYHDCLEIFLMLGGERCIFFGDMCLTLRRGDMALIEPFTLHHGRSCNDGAYERWVMNFSAEDLECILSRSERGQLMHGLTSRRVSLSPVQLSRAECLFSSAREYTETGGALFTKLAYACAAQLLAVFKTTPPSDMPEPQISLPAEVLGAIRFINTRYAEPITLDGAARLAHMSKYHFCRVFRSVTGKTFLEYLHSVRLSRAHEQLLNSSLSLGEIAEKNGFVTAARFSTMFKNAYGATPREFRSLAQRKSASANHGVNPAT